MSIRVRRGVSCLAGVMLLMPTVLCAHGINGHVHVTAWSMAEIEEQGVLEILNDPVAVDALLFGAAFPDTGYAVDGREYGERVHWEPFVERFIRYMRDTYPPPYNDPETRRKIAFLLGVGCHGLQDEIFDTLFLDQVHKHDGAGQDEVDTGTDSFLVVDGRIEYKPAAYAPIDDLLVVFDDLGVSANRETIELGIARVKGVVIDNFDALARQFNDMLRPDLMWTAEHYLDPSIPGSLTSEIGPSAAYIEALWRRLHGEPPVGARVSYSYPSVDGRSRSTEPGVDAWVTLVFGTGAVVGSLTSETVELVGPDGGRVDVEVDHSRWTNDPDSVTRLLVLKPTTELIYDSDYLIRLKPGVAYVDGTALMDPWQLAFKTPCRDPDGPGCAPVLEMGQDAGISLDAAASFDMAGNALDGGLPPSNAQRGSSGNGCNVSAHHTQESWPIDFLTLAAFCVLLRRKFVR
ncbi:MAG: zinc dependent phospholipase C family protein [Bradymonadia bacterium]